MTWGTNSPAAGNTCCSNGNLREARPQRAARKNDATSSDDVGHQFREVKLLGRKLQRPGHSVPKHRETQEMFSYFCGTVPPLKRKLPTYSLRTNSVRDRSKI